MRNRLPTYPGRVHLAPVEGQTNVFDLTRADQPQDPGTPLNKATLLSDDVEALIWGAAADRTPNDAFGKISELYQHWWSVLNSAGTTTYVHSPDRNAYPDSGTVDGLEYNYLGKPFDNAKAGTGVMELTYKGTSSCGSSLSRPAQSLVFERDPRAAFITCKDTKVAWCEPLLIPKDEDFLFVGFYGLDSYAVMTAHYYSETKTLKWYCSSNASNTQVGYDMCMNYNRDYTVKYLY